MNAELRIHFESHAEMVDFMSRLGPTEVTPSVSTPEPVAEPPKKRGRKPKSETSSESKPSDAAVKPSETLPAEQKEVSESSSTTTTSSAAETLDGSDIDPKQLRTLCASTVDPMETVKWLTGKFGTAKIDQIEPQHYQTILDHVNSLQKKQDD